MKSLLKKLSIFGIGFVLMLSSLNRSFAQTDTPTSTIAPSPLGQVVDLKFNIPGIADPGGNNTPSNIVKNVTLYIYSSSINVDDPSSTPIAKIETKAVYDSIENSPTYGKYLNPQIDLGSKVSDGKYQIAFKAERSLPFLIKEDEKDISGKLFDIRGSFGPIIEIEGTVIIGDISPGGVGDNVMDINDYNELVSCFGARAGTNECQESANADLNEDGKVDGVDYNLMFGSFKKLLALGKPVPTNIIPRPTSKPTIASKKPTPIPVAKEKETKKEDRGGVQGLIVIGSALFFLTLLVVLIIMRKKILGIFHKEKNTNISENVQEEQVVDEIIDKEFFVKKQTENTENNTTVLTLTDDNGPTLGYYSGKDVIDGFAHIKGTLRKEGSKVFIDVTEITPVANEAS